MFRRILIANRGEIARRIIKTAHRMNIECIAVFSEADAAAPFVREADVTVCIGPAPARDSYLDMDAILQAAAQTRAEAIHPGYGFLAENAVFAQRVMQERLSWIGPPPRLIRLMGEKSPAKAAVSALGFDLIPGSNGIVGTSDDAAAIARRIGYPVLLKADAGGGGKGMRRAEDEAALMHAWNEAASEASASFGTPDLYLEKCVVGARHIEFQVLADAWGNAVHLFERDCSVQRRHQKLIEEAPSTVLSADRRAVMGAKVAQVIAAVGYVGAGTVEFLFDPPSDTLYFIEMNTRLQVEHPVTEEITGLDLVEAQIRIASGERLWLSQGDIRFAGHAIEARINAEDPAHDFRPSPGVVSKFEAPAGIVGDGRVRVDAAVESGATVSPFYDSLIAKVIAWGKDRDAAIQTLSQALEHMVVEGVSTTIPFHRQVLSSRRFFAGDVAVDTNPLGADDRHP